jgi:hypothetical protein
MLLLAMMKNVLFQVIKKNKEREAQTWRSCSPVMLLGGHATV